MGLKSFFGRWSKSEDARAIERAEEDSRGTALERDLEQEDFEGRKQDEWLAERSTPGSAAEDAAGDDLR